VPADARDRPPGIGRRDHRVHQGERLGHDERGESSRGDRLAGVLVVDPRLVGHPVDHRHVPLTDDVGVLVGPVGDLRGGERLEHLERAHESAVSARTPGSRASPLITTENPSNASAHPGRPASQSASEASPKTTTFATGRTTGPPYAALGEARKYHAVIASNGSSSSTKTRLSTNHPKTTTDP